MSAALGLGLAVVAATCLSLAHLASRNARIYSEPKKVRVFKGETATTLLRLEWGGERWLRTGSLTLDEIPGLEAECTATGPSRFAVAVRPVRAGRFEIKGIKLDVTDPIGLFVARETIPLDLIIESLPLALLATASVVVASPLAVGENPAGRAGTGQELYSVGPYNPDLDTKDIIWKRVARAEDAAISVRVREANIPMSVLIGIALGWASTWQRAVAIDLASEAVAQVGRLLLSLGTSLEVSFALGGALERKRASNMAELVDVVLTISSTSSTTQPMLGPAKFDLLILGPEQLGGLRSTMSADSFPTLVVSEDAIAPGLPPWALSFSGREDLSALCIRVLNR